MPLETVPVLHEARPIIVRRCAPMHRPVASKSYKLQVLSSRARGVDAAAVPEQANFCHIRELGPYQALGWACIDAMVTDDVHLEQRVVCILKAMECVHVRYGTADLSKVLYGFCTEIKALRRCNPTLVSRELLTMPA